MILAKDNFIVGLSQNGSVYLLCTQTLRVLDELAGRDFLPKTSVNFLNIVTMQQNSYYYIFALCTSKGLYIVNIEYKKLKK